jgi:hypothetical protein
VEPDFIAIGILHNLHSLAIADRTNDYNIDDILFAISELSDKMTKSQ